MREGIQSEKAARKIVELVVGRAEHVFGKNLIGVFMIGSLAHGGFAAESSDIDIALLLHQVEPGSATAVAELSKWVAECDQSPLARRVSIFWSDTAHLRDGKGQYMRLGAVDRADLLRSGVCVWGDDIADRSTLPSRAELVVEGAQFAAQMFDEAYVLRPAAELIADGPRAASKYVLFPVRLLYTMDTGEIGLNHAAVAWYLKQGGVSSTLVSAAFAWREDGFSDEKQAVASLEKNGLKLYLELFKKLSTDPALNVAQQQTFTALLERLG